MDGFCALSLYELSSALDITDHPLHTLRFPPLLFPKLHSSTLSWVSSISPSVLSWTLAEAPLLTHPLHIGVPQTMTLVVSSSTFSLKDTTQTPGLNYHYYPVDS